MRLLVCRARLSLRGADERLDSLGRLGGEGGKDRFGSAATLGLDLQAHDAEATGQQALLGIDVVDAAGREASAPAYEESLLDVDRVTAERVAEREEARQQRRDGVDRHRGDEPAEILSVLHRRGSADEQWHEQAPRERSDREEQHRRV